MDVKGLEKEAYVATLRALHHQGGGTTLEKEKLKLLLKKVLRIDDETHLECLEKAMTEKPVKSRGGDGGKRKSSGGSEKHGGGGKRNSSGGQKMHKVGSKKLGSTSGGGAKIDEYVGRKVERFWPQDGGWVSGAISDFNAVTGEHCIVYDLGTPDESWEWYNIRNASPEQCRLVEGEKINLIGKAFGGEVEGLERQRTQLKQREKAIQEQLQQLASDNEDITYSDSD
jgi:hypothetical protein